MLLMSSPKSRTFVCQAIQSSLKNWEDLGLESAQSLECSSSELLMELQSKTMIAKTMKSSILTSRFENASLIISLIRLKR